METVPGVERYMTPAPVTIEGGTLLGEARALMRRHEIRHLPVLEDGELIGLLAERDLHSLETVQCGGWAHLPARSVMSPAPLVVDAASPVTRVISKMVARGQGSVLVRRDGRLVGIFTNVDALIACDELLEQRA